MTKKIIVACGGAVATSTVAANRVQEICDENGIDAEIVQVRILEIAGNLPADLIITTSNCSEDFGAPLVKGMPFISGLGVEETESEIINILKS